MEIRIYNSKLDLKGIIENQTSLMWNRKYNDAGSFELHAPITDENRALIKLENLVYIMGSTEAGVIEYITMTEEPNANEIVASGRFLSSYLDRRITKGTKTYSGKVENIMRQLITEAEPIPLVELGTLNGFDDEVTFQATYKNLLTYMSKLGKQANIGFRFRPDFNNKKIIFETYKGTDHSMSQGVLNRVIFSEMYENLNKVIYTENNQNFRTKIYVGGTGEGNDRVVVEVGGGSGLELREFFYSATDITADNISQAEYLAALTQRGYEQLEVNSFVNSFECETEPAINFIYRKDYDLGDIVTIKKKSWDMTTDLRITAIQEIYEYGALTVVPTFGNPLSETIDWEEKEMSEVALFYTSQSGDRVYDADDFSDWLKKFFTTGVFQGDLMVKASGGMNIKVEKGYANVEGKVMIFDADTELLIETAHPTYNRIDTIVVERNDIERNIVLKVVKGGYSSEPIPTAPVRENGIYQLVLAEIYISNGSTSVLQSNITDKRTDTSVCGIVVTPIDNFDFDQFAVQFNAYLKEFKEGSAADFNQWMINEQLEFNTWKNAEKSDFDTWFANIRYILDGDVAGHLQNEIDELSEKIDNIKLVHIKVSYDAQSLSGGTITVSNGSESYSKPVNPSGETVFDGMSLGIWTISENVQGTSAEIETNFYGNYSAAVGGDIFINVSFDDEFRGKTITCTDGSKTYTKVATGSRVQFCLNDEGTWTIKVTVDDKEYSTTVTVKHNNTYDVTLRYARGLNYTEWLTQAGITKSFASLEDVLADQLTIRTLMTKHASVDYLVENLGNDETTANTVLNAYNIIKWTNLRDYALDMMLANNVLKAIMDNIGLYGYGEVTKDSDGNIILKGNVPIMTANNAPYGECIGDTPRNGYSLYYAFNSSTDSIVFNGTSDKRIGYKFVNPVNLKKLSFKIDNGYDVRAPKNIKVRYSDDGSNWTELQEFSNLSGDVTIVDIINDGGYHLYWDMYILNNRGDANYISFRELQFYGRELKVSVPKMDSNTSPWGECVASSYYGGGYEPYLAYDNDISKGWVPAEAGISAQKNVSWIGYDFKQLTKLGMVMCYHKDTSSRAFKTVWKLQGSVNDVWEDIDTLDEMSSNKWNIKTISTNKTYNKYRLILVDDVMDIGFGNGWNIQFYALDYSEHEERHYIYDHGVEVEELHSYTSSSIISKKDSAVELSTSSSSSTVGLETNNAIDFTPYKLMRSAIDNIVGRIVMGYATAKTTSGTISFGGLVYFSDGGNNKDNLPYNTNIDMKAVNDNNYPVIGINTHANDLVSVTEWWLE